MICRSQKCEVLKNEAGQDIYGKGRLVGITFMNNPTPTNLTNITPTPAQGVQTRSGRTLTALRPIWENNGHVNSGKVYGGAVGRGYERKPD